MSKLVNVLLIALLSLLSVVAFAQDKPAETTKPAAGAAKPAGGTKSKPGNKGPAAKAPSPEEIARESLARGESFKKMGQYDKAMIEYDAALEKYPQLYETYTARASAHFLQLNFTEAMNDYNRAIEICETEMEKFKTQAKIKRVLQDLAGEKLALDEANKLKPIVADAYYQRGNLKQFMDDLEGSCEDLMKSKEFGHLQADTKIAEFCKGIATEGAQPSNNSEDE